MKKLTCEMCGGSDIIKQDGVFVCQSCGLKYTLEEARKMMVEGVVAVQGTVAIDHSSELKNLYTAARNARETSDDESAIRHYESISAKDPDSWEALFYLVVLKTNSIKNSEIASAAVSVSSCLPKVFELINTKLETEEEKKQAVKEVTQQCYTTAIWLTSASHNFYKTMTKGNGVMALTGIFGAISSAGSALTELTNDANRCVTIANIMCYCGNHIETIFDMNDEFYRERAVWSWQRLLGFHDDYQKVHKTQVLLDNDSLTRFKNKITQYGGSTAIEANAQEAVTTSSDSNIAVLTVTYKGNLGASNVLWYAIDDGAKNVIMRGKDLQHNLEKGTHKITILNPMMKKEKEFVIDGPKTINVYGKSFGMDINE